MSNFIKNLKKLRTKVESKGNPNIVRFETGETVLRLVHNPYAEEDIFIPVEILYRSGGVVNETSFSPKTFGQSDPIDDMVNAKLSKGQVSKNYYAKLMSMKSSTSVLAPCVVRGKEKEGVKWANFSKPQFIELSDRIERVYKTDKKNFSLTDPEKAYDIFVTVTQKNKNEPRKYSFDIARATTPLVEDEDLLSQLTEEDAVVDWKELFPALTTDEVLEKVRTSIEMGLMSSKSTGSNGEDSDSSDDTPADPDDYKEKLKSNRTYDYDGDDSDDDDDEEDSEMKERYEKFKRDALKKKEQSKEKSDDEAEDDDMPF